MAVSDWHPLDVDHFSGGSGLTVGRGPDGFNRVDLREILNDLGSRVNYRAVTAGPYALVAADDLRVIEVDPAGGAITITLPAGFPRGFTATIRQISAGTVTIAAGAGATLVRVASAASPVTLAEQWAVASVECRATNGWIVSGQLTP